MFKKPLMVGKNLFANVGPALASGYHGAARAKENIELRIVHFYALSFVTDNAEMLFDGINIHDHSSKEEYEVMVGSSGQSRANIGQEMFMILPGFFRSLKSERVNYRRYETRSQAMADIIDYIKPFYNQKRKHYKLGNISPSQYEMNLQKAA